MSDEEYALVLSGGIALGAFQAGACEALLGRGPPPGWVVGTSVGAITAVLLAGGPADGAADRLRRFWDGAAIEQPMLQAWGGLSGEAGQEWAAWAAVLQAHALGRPGLFHPRLPPIGPDPRPSLYDLSPLRERLQALVDFDRVNGSETRVTLTATDVMSGDRVVWDTEAGTRIGPDQVLASCAFMPLFPPVEVAGRLLVDGGFSANLPADLVLDSADAPPTCVVVDLFAAEGQAPQGLAAAASRVGDLVFGNQARQALDHAGREAGLRATIARLAAMLPDEVRAKPEVAALAQQGRAEPVRVVRVAYRAGLSEAGPGKGFDFSRRTLDARWRAGAAAVLAAIDNSD